MEEALVSLILIVEGGSEEALGHCSPLPLIRLKGEANGLFFSFSASQGLRFKCFQFLFLAMIPRALDFNVAIRCLNIS